MKRYTLYKTLLAVNLRQKKNAEKFLLDHKPGQGCPMIGRWSTASSPWTIFDIEGIAKVDWAAASAATTLLRITPGREHRSLTSLTSRQRLCHGGRSAGK